MKLYFLFIGTILGSYAFGQGFSEKFDDVADSSGTTNLSGLFSRGWVVVNKSNPVGPTAWDAGETEYIGVDQDPSTNKLNPGSNVEYISANFNATSGTGTISDYLITPVVTLSNGSELSFETISDGVDPNSLNVLMSKKGSSTNVGTNEFGAGSDFSTSLLSINPGLTNDGYPTVWTDYTLTVSGLSAPTTGRFAFQYFATQGGPDGANSSYIGIDNATYTPAAVPEPTSLIGLGLGAAAFLRGRKRLKAA